MADDNDLVMESTTDSPEQMAEGLGADLRAIDPVVGVDAETESAPEPEAEPAVEAQADDQGADETTETPAVEQGTRVSRAKTPNGMARAARISASKKVSRLEEENARLKEELRGKMTAAQPSIQPKPVVRSVAPVEPVAPETIPDTHPEVAKALQAVEAIGPKPKSEDFDDFEKFETARDEWIEKRATARSTANFVRQDVARRETTALEQASREFHEVATAYEQTVSAARARHEDYDTAMVAADEQGLAISPDMKDALMRSPVGGEVVYHLVKNAAEVARLNALPPSRALAELGKLESGIEAALKRQPQSQQTTSGGRPSRITRAPEPQGTTLGDLPSNATSSLDDPNLSLAEYNRRRDRMDIESGRRRPVASY